MTQRMSALITVLAIVIAPGLLVGAEPAAKLTVAKPPEGLKLNRFYEKYVDADGLPVISSSKVPDKALFIAADLVKHMLAKRADIRKALIEGKVRIAVMGKNEVTTDIPEHSKLAPKQHWDRRARGLGGTPFNPTTSCAEENLLGYENDRYSGENILIHEFAHTVHEVGMKALDKDFDGRLKKLYQDAIDRGLWKQTYAASNHKEYWAEGVQSYFDCNLRAEPPNGIHNHVRTRAQLEKYDPELAKLIDEVFAKNPWRWVPNGAHERHWKK